MGALKGEVIAGHGNSEADWQASTALAALPETSVSELLGQAQRLVVVAPHPDDEVLGCGGLMAMAARQGYPVHVVCLTDGEAAYQEDPQWPAQRLAPLRRLELIAALKVLGIDALRVDHVGIPDGRISAHMEQAVNALGMIDRRDVVLVTWASDGHPDHEAAAQAALTAAARSGARLIQYPIWAWHWADPHDAAFLANGACRFPLSAWAQSHKQTGIAAFLSQTGQIDPAPSAPILPPHVLARFLRAYEIYLT